MNSLLRVLQKLADPTAAIELGVDGNRTLYSCRYQGKWAAGSVDTRLLEESRADLLSYILSARFAVLLERVEESAAFRERTIDVNVGTY